MSQTFEVRDLRQQDWVWTSKTFLFHPQVDEKMYKVYCGLAAYADNTTQQSYPGIDTLRDKLHMGRSTIIRAISLLEKMNFIEVERKLGEHNIYTLLNDGTPHIDIPEETKPDTPAEIAANFFKGINDLRNKKDTDEVTDEGKMMREFLCNLKEKYPLAEKKVIWEEIQKFERYWTELNSTGKKMKWQKQDTFQVERRLVTWFAKKDQFKNKVEIINKPKRRIV
jgi:hypothetical protein